MSDSFSLICRNYGAPPVIAYEAQPAPQPPGRGQVLVDVQCAAFNFTDHLLLQGRYQDKPDLPFVPGLDAAGIVKAVGQDVKAVQPGDKVVSSGVVGGWSTQLTAPASRLVAVPENVSLPDAVGSINSHLTAYHGLVDRAALKAGERVLILGANGAVGQACMQIAQHLGAQVFTVERQGADGFHLSGPDRHAIHLADQAQLKQGLRDLLGPQGADIVVDPVGDHHTEAAVRNLAWRGRLLVVGFAAGDIPRVPTNLLLLKGAALVGVYCGGLLVHEMPAFTEQLAAMFDIVAAGALTPLAHELVPPHDFSRAWERFSSAPRGTKVLLDFSRPSATPY